MQGYRYYDTPERPHVHTYDDKPLMGGSSVGSVLDKPLAWWASGMAVGTMGWIYAKKKILGKYQFHKPEERIAAALPVLERIQHMLPEEYLALLDEAYRAHNTRKEKAAESGTDRHKILETWVKKCITQNNGIPKGSMREIGAFCRWAGDNVQRFLWSEIHCYSLKYWMGGIADVGWLDFKDKVIVGDFKSAKEAYFVNWIQCANYDIMLNENGGVTADGEKVFGPPGLADGYCIVPFGQEELAPEFIYNTQDFRNAVPWVVGLYKLKQEYDKTNSLQG